MNKAKDFNDVSAAPAKQLVLRINDRGSYRTERVQLAEGQTLSIGRDWRCDIVVQDEYVDGFHLELSNSRSALLLSDKGSTNGSTINGKRLTLENHNYTQNERIKIGDTSIEIFDTALALAPTRIRSRLFAFVKTVDSIRALLLITAAAIAAVLLRKWLSSPIVYDVKQGLTDVISLGVALLGWAVLFGFASRLFRAESAIRTHWILACIAVIVVNVLVPIYSLAQFNAHDALSLEVGFNLIVAIASIAFLYCVFTFSSSLKTSSKFAWALVLVATMFVSTYKNDVFQEDHKKWRSGGTLDLVTLTPALQLSKPTTVDQHFQELDNLFDNLKTATDYSSGE